MSRDPTTGEAANQALPSSEVSCALLVGGASSRLGGYPKGLLRTPAGDTVVYRTLELLSRLGLHTWLVGEAQAYADLHPDLPRLADAPAGVGPIGGLSSALAACPSPWLLLLGCDYPNLSAELLEWLWSRRSGRNAVAPRGPGGKPEPLCALYAVGFARKVVEQCLAERRHSLQAVLERLEARIEMPPDHLLSELEDWDCFDHIPVS